MADGTAKRMMPQRQPERIVSGQAFDEDARIDVSVRPKRLDEYIGQKRVKENIQIAIDAARSRGEALDHVLLYCPPGLGKTTLAQIIANELNVPIKTSAGPLLERKGDLTAILTSLELRKFSSSTKSIAFRPPSKKFSIQRWKIFASTSLSVRGRAPASTPFISIISL